MLQYDFQDLRAFIAVYEARNFLRASESLGSSPSGVSWRIRRLETRIKGILFERQRYGVMPTSAADTLYRYAVRVFALLEEASLAVKPTKGAA